MSTAATIIEATNVAAEAVAAFRASLRGQLITPDDESYDIVRQVHNAMIQRHPGMIAQCVDVADVITAVNFAREHDLTLAVRGGGHNAAGLGVCDDGLVIDLSPMNGVRVDPAARTARAEGGCTWGDIDHATHAFGMAAPSGVISTTGVGGLTLGGGIGNLSRAYGLSIDNVLSVDVVLADGSFVTANADENADLFWAVRGGGGNFGIVTSFLFKLSPIGTVYGGPMFWSIDDAAAMMRYWHDQILSDPKDLGGWFMFASVPPGPPFPEQYHAQNVCGIFWCYTGPADKAEEVFKPIRQFRTPIIDFVGPIPFPALQNMLDPLVPSGMQWYWRADFFNTLSDEAIDLYVQYGSQLPSLMSMMHLYPINGATHRVGKSDTAFSYRDANFAQVIVGVDPDPANNDTIIAWTKAYWEALHPYSAGGAYINFMMDEGVDRIQATYRDNYQRLVEIKNKYDPTNFFHVNQNIKPTV